MIGQEQSRGSNLGHLPLSTWVLSALRVEDVQSLLVACGDPGVTAAPWEAAPRPGPAPPAAGSRGRQQARAQWRTTGMARQVQLAPGSLALVLSPREAGQATEKRGGRALFRAFRRANARCFWNERLAHAASRLAFLGWLQRRVLLVRAPQPCVQVLRDAWRRRALRSPRGFRITAVGECGLGDGVRG